MKTYISLCRWTAQGAQNLKDSPARLDAAKKSFAKNGVKLLNFYMVTGRYDMVFIAEAEDFETMAKAMLKTASAGNITTETLRAFTEDEYRAILKVI